MVDPMASRYTRWVSKHGKSITLKILTWGALNSYNKPAASYTASTIYGNVSENPGRLTQASEGTLLNEVVKVNVSVSVTVKEQDRVVIDSVEYEVGPVLVRQSHKTFLVKRVVQA